MPVLRSAPRGETRYIIESDVTVCDRRQNKCTWRRLQSKRGCSPPRTTRWRCLLAIWHRSTTMTCRSSTTQRSCINDLWPLVSLSQTGWVVGGWVGIVMCGWVGIVMCGWVGIVMCGWVDLVMCGWVGVVMCGCSHGWMGRCNNEWVSDMGSNTLKCI